MTTTTELSTSTRPSLGKRITWVVLDWDETITVSDTMSVLAQASRDPTRWSGFVDAYVADMAAVEGEFGARDSLEAQYDFLGALSACEMRSVGRIEAAGAFLGTTRADVERVSGQIEIRAGFDRFSRRLLAGEDVVHREVLSVNWSREMIRHALARAVDDVDDWTVTANALCFDADGRGTGSVSKDKEGGIRTALDKLARLEVGLAECHGEGGLLLYAGDSNTDLPCLLAADVGVVFGKNASLQETCDRYGIRVRPFAELDTASGRYERLEKTLFRAESWDEVRF